MTESSAIELKPLGARPRVSMVVAWQGSPLELSRRLRAWRRPIDENVDVVVACACGPAEQQRLERAHPGVRIMPASPGSGIHALRQIGVAAAHGDIVVIFDDSVSSDASWREALPPSLGGSAIRARVERVGYDHGARMEEKSLT